MEEFDVVRGIYVLDLQRITRASLRVSRPY